MTSQLSDRLTGTMLMTAGLLWTASVTVLLVTEDGTPVKNVALLVGVYAVPVLLILGFAGMLIRDYRASRLSRTAVIAYVTPILGCMLLMAASTNEALHDNELNWEAAWWSVFLFIVGLALSAAILSASGRMPRWSTVPLIVVGAFASAAWMLGQPVLNLIALPGFIAVAIILAVGIGVIILGSRVLRVDPITRSV